MSDLRDLAFRKLKPLDFLQSAMYFFALSTLIGFGVHVLIPRANLFGLEMGFIYFSTLTLASMIGIGLSFELFVREEKAGELKELTFRSRFMLPKFNMGDLLWGIGLLLFWVLSLIVLKKLLAPYLVMPDYLISNPGTFYGFVIKGNWLLLIAELVFLTINIAGEEFFWRGYMMPRQILAFGKNAWIVNGSLWALFHLPFYWIMPTLIPGCLALAYVSQKRRSIWPALLAHFALNALDAYMILLSGF